MATSTMAEYFMVSLRKVTVYNKAANTAPKRYIIPLISAASFRSRVISITITPANDTAIPIKLTGVSFSLKLRYPINGEKTGMVAIITAAKVGDENFNP